MKASSNYLLLQHAESLTSHDISTHYQLNPPRTLHSISFLVVQPCDLSVNHAGLNFLSPLQPKGHTGIEIFLDWRVPYSLQKYILAMTIDNRFHDKVVLWFQFHDRLPLVPIWLKNLDSSCTRICVTRFLPPPPPPRPFLLVW